MSKKHEEHWITGEEFNRETRRLDAAGVPPDGPEYQALWERCHKRDDYLYESFGRQHYDSHYGQWVAISLTGDVLFREKHSDCVRAATEEFGLGDFAVRRLSERPYLSLHG